MKATHEIIVQRDDVADCWNWFLERMEATSKSPVDSGHAPNMISAQAIAIAHAEDLGLGVVSDDEDGLLLAPAFPDGAPKCIECGHLFDDNPGEEMCATCADWIVRQ